MCSVDANRDVAEATWRRKRVATVPAFAPAETALDRAWPALKAPALARGAAAILVGLLALAALVVAERRLAGALVVPLGPLALSCTAAVAALFAAGARFAWRNSESPGVDGAERGLSLRERACFRGAKADYGPSWLSPSNAMHAVVRWLPPAALVVLGVSLWLPAARLEAIACFWSIAVVEEAWSLLPRRRNLAESSDSADSRPAEKIELHIRPAAPMEFSGAAEVDLEEVEEVDGEALETAASGLKRESLRSAAFRARRSALRAAPEGRRFRRAA
jgi:hypothetical protein